MGKDGIVYYHMINKSDIYTTQEARDMSQYLFLDFGPEG